MNIIQYKHIVSRIVIKKCPKCGEELSLLAWDNEEKKKACDNCLLVYDFVEPPEGKDETINQPLVLDFIKR